MLLRNPHHLWLRLLFALGAMALFVAGYQWGNQLQRAREPWPPAISGVLIAPPLALPEIRLQDPLGRPVGRAELADAWQLLALGDLTQASGQLAVQRLLEAANRLADRPALRERLGLVLVTTTDTPDLAREFQRLSLALTVLSGEPQALATLVRAFGLATESGADLFVLAPGGLLVALLPASQAGASLANDLVTLMSADAARWSTPTE